MAARRGSAITTDKKNFGEPYQIFHEVENTGKNVQGSKKKIKWIFGFSESDEEIEVILIHSVVSGKKTIFENGREIVSSSNMLATDFSHGWTSPICNRFFRIELTLNVTTEHEYVFSVDGVKFSEFPKKPIGGNTMRRTSTDSRYGSEMTSETTATRRISTTGFGNTNPPPVKDNTPVTKKNSLSSHSFDPFTESEASSFDPFSNSNSNTKASPKTTSLPPPTSAPPMKSVTSSLFSNIEDSAPAHNVAAQSFDAFDSNGFGSQPFGSDGFGSAPADTFSSSNSFDPFGTPSSQSIPASTTKSPASSIPPPQKITPPQHMPAKKSSNDFFGEPIVQPPQRRASAQEISMDFAGLSFGAQPLQSQSTAKKIFEEVEPTPEPVPQPQESAKPVDPWSTHLVDLDLTGKTNPQRRQSVNSTGPTLDNLMGVSNSQRRTSQGGSLNTSDILNTMNDPFGAPSFLPAQTLTPQTQPIRPINASQAISSLGPNNPPQYGGMGYGSMPPQPPMSGTRSSFIGAPMGAPMGTPMGGQMGGPMGGPMGAAPMNSRASFTGGIPFPASNQPKSSLDTLDWRT